MENLKVKISINGRETEKYKLQTLVTDIESQELWIILETKEPSQN